MIKIPQKFCQTRGCMVRNPDKILENAKNIRQKYPPSHAEIETKFMDKFGSSSGKFQTKKIKRVTLKNGAESPIFFEKSKVLERTL